MKRTSIVVLAILSLLCINVRAEMDQAYLGASVIGTNSGTASKIVRGEVASAIVVIPAGCTADVSVVSSDGESIFVKTGMTAGTNIYPLLYPAYGSTGVALTETYSVWNGVTNSTGTNPVRMPLPVMGEVTATWVGQVASTTNTYVLKLNFKK